MTINIKLTRKTKFVLLIAALAAVLLIFNFNLDTHKDTKDPNDILRISAAKGVRENIAKLTSAVLVWNYERKCFGVWAHEPEVIGNYQLWWNKNKTAISLDNVTSVKDPNGLVTSNKKKTFMSYNGKKFLEADMPAGGSGNNKIYIQKKSAFYGNENYLRTIGWQGLGVLNLELDEKLRKHREPGTEKWSTVDSNDGIKLIKWEFHNSKTGQVGIKYYDPQQGFGVVFHDGYASEGHLQSRQNLRYIQVSGGAWFPVEYNTTNFNIQNGEIIMQSNIKINIEKSVFNSPSAIPSDVFEFKPGPNDELLDETSFIQRIKHFLNDF
jgi:hypothetical protein